MYGFLTFAKLGMTMDRQRTLDYLNIDTSLKIEKSISGIDSKAELSTG